MKKSRSDVIREIKEVVALDLYKKGRISSGKAGEMLGLSKREMLSLLNYKKLPINYDVDDLKSDLKTLDKLIK
ncbi:MAG: hypothetical protein A7316_05220 [Candidatus Altiarchaeales archaeon WOR_SM1_86-2]|nr:MAG: hypothetical protein A7315_04905 [Candidatus Altiarchaeales archaeon WOR_SM1_79]ODS39510.1 MAG: hypothetical protein A7316_05220 [Candidatus Altiarchaeales archaeon WOR_SM1_86-2]